MFKLREDQYKCLGFQLQEFSQKTEFMHYRQAFSLWASSWLSSKNLPAMPETQETWVWSLGWEDPLEEEMATHSVVLAWKISWTEKSCVLHSMGSQRVGHVRVGHACTHTCTHTHTVSLPLFHHLFVIGWQSSIFHCCINNRYMWQQIQIHFSKRYIDPLK